MEIKLKPCPFCGGEARFNTVTVGNGSAYVGFRYTVECRNCLVELPMRYETRLSLNDYGDITFLADERKKAADFWNRKEREV